MSDNSPTLGWKTPEEKPQKGERILVFSDCYAKEDIMRYRLMDAQFLKVTTEATLWISCDELLTQIPQIPIETSLMEWCKNLASTSKEGDIKMRLLNASEDLQLDFEEVNLRYQSATQSDFDRKEGIYFILTGEKFPSKKGYTWL